MNKVTFTPCLRKKYSNDKDGIINIRVTENRKSKYFSLKININENDWNYKKCEIKEKHKESNSIKREIENEIVKLKKVYLQTDSIDVMKVNNQNSFLVFFKSHINHLISRRQIGTSKNSQTCLSHITSFIHSKGKGDLLFSEITIEIVTDFETYLLSKNIAPNTTKKYVSVIGRIFNLAVKSRVFLPTTNPFILFENKKLPVEKQILQKRDVEAILSAEIDFNDSLYNVRNCFLFQIFGQGMRVGDLLTLKWGTIVEGVILFYQLKTKMPHKIPLNDIIVFILKDFLPDRCNSILDNVYTIETDKKYQMTYKTLNDHYKTLAKMSITKFAKGNNDAVELMTIWKRELNEVRNHLTYALTYEINKYAKTHPNKFIFGLLREDDFKGVKFNAQTTLSKFQYNQVSSKTTIYNRQLKLLQKACGFEINFVSHLPRHTYTNLLIESSNRDIYVISKSLGHRRLAATESYISDFNTERVEEVVNDLTGQFSFM